MRVFELHHSVFSDWKPDTPEILNDAIDNDIKLMKLDRIIKDDDYDKAEVISILKEHC